MIAEALTLTRSHMSARLEQRKMPRKIAELFNTV